MADILWKDVVGAATVTDGGYVGDLLKLARAHVDEAIKNNELTQSDAGQIYTAMIPAAFQNGIMFALEEELTEAKISSELDKLATNEKQRELLVAEKGLTTAKTTSELDKLATNAKQRDLFIAEKDLTEAKGANERDRLLTNEQQRAVLVKQAALYKRQAAAFDDKKYQNILDTQMNAWGITFQDTDTTFIPSQLTQGEFNISMDAVRRDYGV